MMSPLSAWSRFRWRRPQLEALEDRLAPAITVVAGTGTAGYGGDGGPATAAQLGSVEGVAVDAAGDLFITGYNSSVVRKVNPAGIITTVAGNGGVGYSGDGGPATAAQFSVPVAVAVDAAGDLFIADQYNNAVREVSPAGIINTVAAGLDDPVGVAVGPNGDLIVSDFGSNRVLDISPPLLVKPATADNLQAVLSPSSPVTIQAGAGVTPATVIAAVNALSAPAQAVTITLDLNGGTYDDTTVNPPTNVTLIIDGSSGSNIFVGHSPAFVITSGNVIVKNVTFTTATNSPTILVTGGRLTLRNDVIQESTGYNQMAIQVTGGTVDLGTTASSGGNTLNVNGPGAFVSNATATPVPAVGNAFTVNGAPLSPGSLSGLVWEDFNDDGQVDFGENGIRGVTVLLTGTDDLGNPVSLAQTTTADGAYVFLGLRPGTYRVTETQPAGYLQGIDTVGTAGGSLAAADQFLVPLGPQVNGLNYNFGEQPAATGSVKKGQAAGIGFWNNKNGQALIKALPVVTNPNGSVTSVANWLAATLPHMFGIYAGSNNLTGQSNAYVAALF
jgi:hypothetical protein